MKIAFDEKVIEAGCDEAGRGCLAGPVVAAAVILPQSIQLPYLNDSKKLSEKKRLQLEVAIKTQAIAWAVGLVSPQEIDAINILNASFLAMHRALDQLAVVPELLLIDGNRFTPYKEIRHECIIGGDGKFAAIAAASILAKSERDRIMADLHATYPAYCWSQNKGYPTQAHRQAIAHFGASEHHRKSFTLLKKIEG
ncbi:MAG: ribonuclease HII [Schleiferiaceae bacterium]|nr:ribonuclease HII [Schleiferiaceae bacterium]